MARVVDVQKMSGASSVSYSVLNWGWVTVELLMVAKIVATMIRNTGSIRPEVSHYFSFVDVTTAHGVAAGGIAFVAVVGVQAALAGVLDGYIPAVRPTIVGVVEFACCVGGCVAAAASSCVIVSVVWLKVLNSGFEFSNFSVLCGELHSESVVGGCEVSEHLAVGCCGCGKVGKCIRCVIDKRIHRIVRVVKSDALACVLGDAQILMCFSKLCFKVGPGLLCFRTASPFAATFGE